MPYQYLIVAFSILSKKAAIEQRVMVLNQKRVDIDEFTRKKFFIMGMVKHYSCFPVEVVAAAHPETFKIRLDGALGNLT